MFDEGKVQMAKKIERQNRRAVIRTRYTDNGKLRTETANRSDGINVAASTVPRNNSTVVYLDGPGGSMMLDGRLARTLYRVLSQHYAYKDVNGCGRRQDDCDCVGYPYSYDEEY